MGDVADLFPGFETHRIDLQKGHVFARSSGRGPALALIHGFPQTHVEWHRVARQLSERFTVVLMDLRGYGSSAAPPSRNGELYSKRAMGDDIVQAMQALGHSQLAVIGHDRGARVAYRLALDHPELITRIALLDIIPTVAMWDSMDAARAMQVYHWTFLAQPYPFPETLLSKTSREYLDHTLASWTKDKSLAMFDQGALAHYRAFFEEPARIHACCEDYRAGSTIDLENDRADLHAGRTIRCPTLVLWGDAGVPAGSGPLEVWRSTFAPHATGRAIASGHFLPEENPQDTLAALTPFLLDPD